MKQLLILILTFSILSSCDRNKSEKTQPQLELQMESETVSSEKKKDTIFNYWELILDTIADQKEFKILNKSYELNIKTFSLNDSLIIRNLGSGEYQAYLDHSHTMITDLILTSDSITDRKRIDRTDFKNSLIPEFYSECNLFSTEVDSIVDNRIYLASDLTVPDTDSQWRVWYSIKITNSQLGNIEIRETDYVGM